MTFDVAHPDLLFAGVVLLAKAVRMVPQGYEWTVEAFGKYTHALARPATPDAYHQASGARST